jgi:hypothetical protein
VCKAVCQERKRCNWGVWSYPGAPINRGSPVIEQTHMNEKRVPKVLVQFRSFRFYLFRFLS